MTSVLPTPHPVRRERQQTGDESDDAVRPLGFEERTVPTIVEDDERANKKQPAEQSKRNTVQQGDIFEEVAGHPNGRNGNKRIDDLPYGFAHMRLLEISDQFLPLFVGGGRPLLRRCLRFMCEIDAHLHHQRRGVLIIGQGVEPKKVVF